MKNDEILHSLEHIDADLIRAADALPKKKRTRPYLYAAVAAVLAVAIVLPIALKGLDKSGNLPQIESRPTVPPTAPPDWTDETVSVGGPTLEYLSMVEPVYPTMVDCPVYANYENGEQYQVDYLAWKRGQNRQYNQPDGYADSLTNFFQGSMAQFLQGDGNTAYSPVNVYLAMAMLAETAHGNSRWQLLNLFGLENIDQLRKQASYVWNAHYSDDSRTTLKLANSLWLDDAYTFKQDTANRLADSYYASSLSGDLGSEEVNQKLQAWLNQNTAGLLQQQAKNIELNPNTVFALASTAYFSASWEEEFDESDTADGTFHGLKGDTIAQFMYKFMENYAYYGGDNFTAVSLRLSGNNNMWLILPDEGYTVAEILQSDEYLQMIMNANEWENKKNCKVHLYLPKFDVSDQKDLITGMKAMGITDVFNASKADFTAITDDAALYVDKINHAVRVAVNETGCFGASFTVIEGPTMSIIPDDIKMVNFVLDRPFLFVVSSRDNLPLFAGVVNEP